MVSDVLYVLDYCFQLTTCMYNTMETQYNGLICDMVFPFVSYRARRDEVQLSIGGL